MEIDREDRRSILNWLKEKEALPLPWVMAGMGRPSQGYQQAAKGRDFEALLLVLQGQVEWGNGRMGWKVG